MEKYCFSNKPFLEDLSNRAIRDKQRIIEIWIGLIETMIYHGDRDCSNSEIIVIKDGNIKRAFFLRDNQIFSLHLPFHFYKDENKRFKVRIQSIEIEGWHLHILKEIISNENFLNKSIDEDIDSIIENIIENKVSISDDEINQIYIILKTLMLAEDGYLRYDIDFKNHPNIPHHLDIFYSNTSTFKLGIDINTAGIKPTPNHNDMKNILLDILDENTFHFIQKRQFK